MLYTDENATWFDIVNLYGDTYSWNDFPIWNESKREWLMDSIYNHFEFREIAQDTPSQFYMFLRRKLNEVMPTYNPVFKLLDEQNDLNKLNSVEQVSEAFDFPQNQLESNGDYASSAGKVTTTNVINSASTAQIWLMGVNNALEMLFSELEVLFIQIF